MTEHDPTDPLDTIDTATRADNRLAVAVAGFRTAESRLAERGDAIRNREFPSRVPTVMLVSEYVKAENELWEARHESGIGSG